MECDMSREKIGLNQYVIAGVVSGESEREGERERQRNREREEREIVQ